MARAAPRTAPAAVKPTRPPSLAPARLSYRPLDDLIPYARNARTHSAEQIAKLAASIEEFGFAAPVLADDQGIIAGHGRVVALRKLVDLGRTVRLPSGEPLEPGQVPVIDCSGWTATQRHAYILADNRLTLEAGWDEQALAIEMKDLQLQGFNLDLVGFTEGELSAMLNPLPLAGSNGRAEGAPEPPTVPVSRLGDVWRLGPHRRRCCVIELAPADCDLVIGYWQEISGKQARRADGPTFEEVHADREPETAPEAAPVPVPEADLYRPAKARNGPKPATKPRAGAKGLPPPPKPRGRPPGRSSTKATDAPSPAKKKPRRV
jgi:hypothetical protein